jgi:Na+-driven multidrug efflux pump
MAATGLVLFVFAATITGWFTNEPDVLRIGTRCMQIIAAGFPMYAIGMVIVQAMNGAGDTETPMTLNLISFWLVQIPAAFVLATMTPLGVYGAFLAVVLSESLLTILSVIVFRRGGWKKHAA